MPEATPHPATPAATAPTAPAATPAPAAGAGGAAAPATLGAAPVPKGAKASFEDVKARARAAAAAPAAKPDDKAPAAAPAAAKPDDKTPPPKDPDLEAQVRLHAEDRRLKEEAKRIELDKAAIADREKQLAADRELITNVKAAKDKGDVLALLRSHGFSDADIYEGEESVIFKLAELRGKLPQLAASEQIAKVVQDKLDEKAAEAKAEEERKAKEAEEAAKKENEKAAATIATAKTHFSRNVARIAHENAAKYPSLVALEVPITVVTEYAWNTLINSEGKIELTEEEALADMEKHFKAKRDKAAALEAPKDDEPDPAKKKHDGKPGVRIVKPSPNPNWQATTPAPAGGGGGGGDRPKSLKEKEADMRARARQVANSRR